VVEAAVAAAVAAELLVQQVDQELLLLVIQAVKPQLVEQ
jgi:hypothetical protein